MSIAASQNKFENNYQPRQYGVSEYESMPVYTPPEEPQKPKKSKFKKFLSGFAIFIVIVGFAAIKVAVSDEKTEPDAGYDDSMLFNTVAYTSGEITDGVYTNEWANLKYTIPEGYAQLEASEIGHIFENATDENVGFYIVKVESLLLCCLKNTVIL